MLGKAKGQILRVAACLQLLFCDETDSDYNIVIATTLPTVIGADALKAAENYVDVCCQHTAYLTGRQLIEHEVKRYKESKYHQL